jgi:hypothetical protein
MIRRTLILLTSLLLAGCIDASTSYYIEGGNDALTVRANQEYFWEEDVVGLTLVVSHLPDCQRQFALAKVPRAAINVELFAGGENMYAVRVGKQVWMVDAQACTRLEGPVPAELGVRLGVFKLETDEKMVFVKAAAN